MKRASLLQPRSGAEEELDSQKVWLGSDVPNDLEWQLICFGEMVRCDTQ